MSKEPAERAGKEYAGGLKDGVAIGLGYLSVSFAFGVAAAREGVPLWAAVAISMTNLTSAGQLAGLSVIAACGPFVELILTQLVINLRYALMSLSLSQKLDPSVSDAQRLLIAFGNTDEIFAVSSGRDRPVTASYFAGLLTLPWICWTLGTLLGAAANRVLPASILEALGIAIYGMLIAVVLPAARRDRAVAMVVAAAVVLSCAFAWVPGLKTVSAGFAVIICGVAASVLGAVLRPVEE